MVRRSQTAPGLLVCAPHILLSPTFRAIHAAVRKGEVGRLLSGRGRYGWAGPDWNSGSTVQVEERCSISASTT